MWKQITKEQIKQVKIGDKIRVNGVETRLGDHDIECNFGFGIEDEVFEQSPYPDIFMEGDWRSEKNVVEIWEDSEPLTLADLKPGDKLIVEGEVDAWKEEGVRLGDIITVDSYNGMGFDIKEWDSKGIHVDEDCLRAGDVSRWLGEEPISTPADTQYHVDYLDKTYDSLPKAMIDAAFFDMVESKIQLREVDEVNVSLLETIINSVPEDVRKQIVLDALGIGEVV